MKTQYWLTFLLGLLLFLYFIPRPIMYSEYEIVGWIIYGLIFGLLPYLVYKTIDTFNSTTEWRVGFAALSVLIVGPTFGLYQGYCETQELKKKGIWTKAIVTDEKYINTKNYHGWSIQCSFIANGKRIKTSFTDDYENKYSIGDTLDIIYSKDFPKIYEIGYQWN